MKTVKTLAEKIKVMQAALEGKKIEYVSINDRLKNWSLMVGPDFNWIDYDYRVALTKSYINPDQVAEKYKYMATDVTGITYLYTQLPTLLDSNGIWIEKEVFWSPNASSFSSFVPGTCDWKDSLVRIRD